MWLHDVAQRMMIRRKSIAKDAGLPELDVGTYPAEPSSVTINNGGFLKGALVGGLMAIAGAGAAGLAVHSLSGDRPAASVEEPQEFDLVIESAEGGITVTPE